MTMATTWKRGWAVQWKKKHCVPWACELCNCSNPYKSETCSQCGKKAPSWANQLIEDAAAKVIQGFFRRLKAKRFIAELCLNRYCRKFDRHTGELYYMDNYSGERLSDRPHVLKQDMQLDEREELEFNEYLAQRKEKKRLKGAFEEREALRKQERKAKRLAEEKEKEDEIFSRWKAPFIQAERTGELIANWQNFVEIHPQVYEMGPNLTNMRLIGNPFVKLPGSLFSCLERITILALSNCDLVHLPNEITQLPTLTDLNLIKNKLTRLPDRFGDLNQLTSLHLCSNMLVELPKSFSKLVKLPRLNLEQNDIKIFPDNIVELKCKILSWSKMKLRQLPQKIACMGDTLVSLSVDHNRVRRIPKGIGKLVNLRHLSLCDNQIRLIPDEICNCISLQRLWLDWNQISELPSEFLKLEALESIHLEGNPMRIPEMDVIVEGVPKLREWFVNSVEFYREKDRKEICQKLQNMLATMHDEKLHDVAFYEPGFKTDKIGESHDLYHAFTPGYLFDCAIPRWNEYVEELSHKPELAQEKLNFYSSRQRKIQERMQAEYEAQEQLIQNEMNEVEVENAGGEEEESEDESDEDSDDDTNNKKKRKKYEEFDEEEQLKAQKKKEQQERIMREMKETETQKPKLPEETRLEATNQALAMVVRQFETFDYKEDEVRDALEHYEDVYGRIAIHGQMAKFRRCKCQREGKPRYCVPPDLDFNCERPATFFKIKMVTYMEKLKIDSLNMEAEALEKKLEEVEEKGREYARSEEGVAFFRVMSHRETTRILEEERKARYKLRRKVRLEKKRRKEETKRASRREKLQAAKQARIKELEQKRFKLVAVLERSKGWEAKECQEKIDDIDDEMDNHPQDVELEILETSQEVSNERFKISTLDINLLKRYRPRNIIHASLHEAFTRTHARRKTPVKGKLIEAYIITEKRKATYEVRREFRITRRIMFNWLHLNVKLTFQAWRGWVRKKIYWKKHLAMEKKYDDELTAATAQAEVLYKQAELEKWVKDVDPYTDNTFWQHSETQEIVWEEPLLENMVYIPRIKYA